VSQAETLALVATAVDNASGPLKAVRKALDDLAKSGNLGDHQKEIERFRRELGGLAGSTGQLRQGSKHLDEFAARSRAMSAQIAAAAATINRGLIPVLGAAHYDARRGRAW
jgi:methyl-accepting chemotaxis protein